MKTIAKKNPAKLGNLASVKNNWRTKDDSDYQEKVVGRVNSKQAGGHPVIVKLQFYISDSGSTNYAMQVAQNLESVTSSSRGGNLARIAQFTNNFIPYYFEYGNVENLDKAYKEGTVLAGIPDINTGELLDMHLVQLWSNEEFYKGQQPFTPRDKDNNPVERTGAGFYNRIGIGTQTDPPAFFIKDGTWFPVNNREQMLEYFGQLTSSGGETAGVSVNNGNVGYHNVDDTSNLPF